MPNLLDHVAIRVADRAAVTAELLSLLQVEVIEQTERFTLIGAHPDAGKLTLLDAEHDEQPSAERIVSVVLADTADALAAPVQLDCGLLVTFADPADVVPDQHGVPRHALIGITIRSMDPPIAAAELEQLHGMHVASMNTEVAVIDMTQHGGGRITIARERWDTSGPRLLDHVGIRVASLDRWEDAAQDRGVEIARRVEAAHSKAVFVEGPEQLLLEYVELTAAFQRA